MAAAPRILAFAGSTRRESLNRKLLAVAVRGAEAAGAVCTLASLGELAIPLYDGDLEAKGMPEGARELRRLFLANDGLLIASPEYNGSLTGVLKNAIDWTSRSDEGPRADLAPFRGKTVALVSASPGNLGGLRSLVHVRQVLAGLGCLVIPEQLALARAADAFAPDGSLLDPGRRARAEAVGARLAEVIRRLS